MAVAVEESIIERTLCSGEKSLRRPAVVLALRDVIVRKSDGKEDLSFVAQLTRDLAIPIDDDTTIQQRGALPEAVSERDVEALLACGHAGLLIAEKPDHNGKMERVGFQLGIWGDVLVPWDEQDWIYSREEPKEHRAFPGYVLLSRKMQGLDRGDICHEKIAVRYQGQGIGTALMLAAIQEARESNPCCTCFFTKIDQRNEPSRRFHESFGMKEQDMNFTDYTRFPLPDGAFYEVQWIEYRLNPQEITNREFEALKTNVLHR